MKLEIITKDVEGNIIHEPRENNNDEKYVRIVNDVRKEQYVNRIKERITMHETNIKELQDQLLALGE